MLEEFHYFTNKINFFVGKCIYNVFSALYTCNSVTSPLKCFPGRAAPPAQPLLPRHGRLHALLLAGEARLVRVRVRALGGGAEQGRRGRRARGHPGGPQEQPRRAAQPEEAGAGARLPRPGPRAGDEALRPLRRDERQDLQPAQGGLRSRDHGRAAEAEAEAEAVEETVLCLGAGWAAYIVVYSIRRSLGVSLRVVL